MLDEVANKNMDSFFFEIQKNIMMASKKCTQLLQRPEKTYIVTFYAHGVGLDQRLQRIL